VDPKQAAEEAWTPLTRVPTGESGNAIRAQPIRAQQLLCARLQYFGEYSCARLYGERDMAVRLSAPPGRLADEFFDQSIYHDPRLSRLVLRTTTNYLRDDLDSVYEVKRAPAPDLQKRYRYALVLFRAASAFDREELSKRIGHASGVMGRSACSVRS
jgi:hypothetical protein